MKKLTQTLLLSLGIFSASAQAFELSSSDIKPNKTIAQKFAFNGFGCTGNNLSPALSWKNAPANAKGFAVMVHDSDATTGGAGFWHWVVINLPANTTHLQQGAGTADGKLLPVGSRQIATDFGTPGWGGPCPPTGEAAHHYKFTIYALKTDKIDLPENATASLAGFMLNMNSIDKASFTSKYGR